MLCSVVQAALTDPRSSGRWRRISAIAATTAVARTPAMSHSVVDPCIGAKHCTQRPTRAPPCRCRCRCWTSEKAHVGEGALCVFADPGDGRSAAHQGLRERLACADRQRSDQLDGWPITYEWPLAAAVLTGRQRFTDNEMTGRRTVCNCAAATSKRQIQLTVG